MPNTTNLSLLLLNLISLEPYTTNNPLGKTCIIMAGIFNPLKEKLCFIFPSPLKSGFVDALIALAGSKRTLLGLVELVFLLNCLITLFNVA